MQQKQKGTQHRGYCVVHCIRHIGIPRRITLSTSFCRTTPGQTAENPPVCLVCVDLACSATPSNRLCVRGKHTYTATGNVARVEGCVVQATSTRF